MCIPSKTSSTLWKRRSEQKLSGRFFKERGRFIAAGLFEGLEVSHDEAAMAHLGAHDVVYIDFSVQRQNGEDYEGYGDYIGAVREGVIAELAEAFPGARLAGEAVRVETGDYAAVSMGLGTREEILSAMVVYGFLTYCGGKASIPNHELVRIP